MQANVNRLGKGLFLPQDPVPGSIFRQALIHTISVFDSREAVTANAFSPSCVLPS
jgi:hypothetical protein